MVSNIALPKPKDWQDFERKTCALFACILRDPNTQMHGRTGQSQRGIDIWGYRNQDSRQLVGIQCKLSADPITLEEFEVELEKAKTFRPPISEFFLVSTTPRDVKLQQRARELTADLATTDQPIVVRIWGWEDLEESASQYSDAWRIFDPTFNPFAVEAHRETLQKLESIDAGFQRTQATLPHFGNTQLLPAEPSSFDGKLKDFNDEYLVTGDERSAIPFGGRGRDIRMLDEWLGDNETAPRFLLVGPAGRGKSALLVHWIAHLRATKRIGHDGESWRLVFFPISMRFATNLPNVFYQALAANINEIVRGKMRPPAEGTDAAIYYQDQCRRLLDLAIEKRIRILVVVDGVDEALGGCFGASWFPRTTGTFVRILVSARLQIGDRGAQGWLERLNWIGRVRATSHFLPTLQREDLLDIVLHGGEPLMPLAARRDFLDQLVNLTGGEPLLARLYIEDLTKRSSESDRLTVDDLVRIKPGFGPYFRDWIERQQEAWQQEHTAHSYDENTLQAYLCVLACAYGPLTPHQLSEIAKTVYPIVPAFSVQTALRPLRRFIIGSDKHSPAEEPGYTLSHPKLGEFLREEYFDQQRIRETQIAFAEWGRRILNCADDGMLSPGGVPEYLLQYLSQHFDDLNLSAEDYIKFTEENWMRAWEHFEGGYRGFSQDVHRADRIVMNFDNSRLKWARRVRCQLLLSSIATAQSRTPSTMIVALFKCGAVTEVQALRLIDSQEEHRRLATIVALAPLLSPKSCEEGLQIAERIGSRASRAQALTTLASRITGSERERAFEQAFEAIEQIKPEWLFSETFSSIVHHLPTSLLDRAFALAHSIVAAEDQAAAILSLVPHTPPQDQVALIDEIKATVCSTEWYYRNRDLLPSVVPRMSRAARSTLIGGWITRDKLPDPETLIAFAPFFEEEALKTFSDFANGLEDPAKRATSLAALSHAMPEAARIDTLRKSLRSIREIRPVPPIFDMFGGNPGLDGRAEALCAVAPFLSEELHEEALSIACSIPIEGARKGDSRIDALFSLIPVLTGSTRIEAFAHALEIARSSKHQSGLAIAKLISSSAADERQDLVREALALIETSDSWFGGDQAEAIRLIAPYFSADLVDQVLNACRAIERSDERAEAFAAVLPCLPRSNPASVSREALYNARLIDDKKEAVETLAAISACLGQETPESHTGGKRKSADYRSGATLLAEGDLFEGAMTAAKSIASINSAPEHFLTLVPLVPPEKRMVLMKEALTAVREGRRGFQANAIEAIAQHLPPMLAKQALSIVGEIYDVDERGIATAWLAAHLRPPLQIEALASFISQASQMSRAHLLRALKPLCPLIAQISDRESLHEISRAICDVREWFP